jgi:aminoglycoside phosphotransferase (APT) family kinase protein
LPSSPRRAILRPLFDVGTSATAIETVADLLAAARRHGLALTTAQADFDRSGLDYLVVHAVDDAGVRWIVRTPRRPEVFAASRVEASVLALVRPRLPVAAPDWRVHAPDVIAYPRLAGTPAVTLDTGAPVWNLVDPSAPSEAFLASFAAALAAIQSVAPDEARRAGVPVTPIALARQDLARAMDETRDALAPDDPMWARWQRWLADDAVWPDELALVHGDLHPGHMLLDDDGRLAGILDWTEAAVTDPSLDVAMFFGCFGKAATETMIAHLARAGGRTSPRLLEHAAERWAAFPVLGAQWAMRTGNEAVLAFAKATLATSMATMAEATS